MYMLASVCRPQRAEVRVGGAELPHPATSVTSYTEVILVGSTLDTGIRERNNDGELGITFQTGNLNKLIKNTNFQNHSRKCLF